MPDHPRRVPYVDIVRPRRVPTGSSPPKRRLVPVVEITKRPADIRPLKRLHLKTCSEASPSPRKRRKLLEEAASWASSESDFDHELDTSRQSPQKSRQKTSDQKTSAAFIPYATPIVREIATPFFKQNISLCGKNAANADVEAEDRQKFKSHKLNPKLIQLGPWDDELGTHMSVVLDGIEYSVGDTVMVEAGDDVDATRQAQASTVAAHSSNHYGNQVWFCRIWGFHEDEPTCQTKFHAQWYVHGSKTLLQETAHSTSLFLIEECDDLDVECIIRKFELHMLAPSDKEPKDEKLPHGDVFHCSLLYDKEELSFKDLPGRDELAELFSSTGKCCHNCAVIARNEELKNPKWSPDELVLHGTVYHPNDFAYIALKRKASDDLILPIAQIISFQPDKNKLQVRFFEHVDDKIAPDDERRLVPRQCTNMIEVSALDGKCFVRPLATIPDLSTWIAPYDHWYTTDPDLELCLPCLEEHIKTLHQQKAAKARHHPLRGLELFAGAGGLSTGMDLSDYVKTVAVVEWDKDAVGSFRSNHPDCVAVHGDVNKVLLELQEKPLSTRPNSLPRKGTIDFIFGGPPCQPFSGANHRRKAVDDRTTLPITMLSYAEFYSPQYFLLENVAGILSYPLLGIQESVYKVSGGIRSGMVKIILRVLIGLGYQVHFKLLQAGQYGAPQSRQRLIFWGAKRGLKLPDFPVPTHAFNGPAFNRKIPALDQQIPCVTRANSASDTSHHFAPLPFVTVNDAIGDLPPFDWINPLKSKTDSEYPQFNAESSSNALPGFVKPTRYLCPPKTQYQQWLRRNGDDMVTGQYNDSYASTIVEATTAVPLRPGACHKGTLAVIVGTYLTLLDLPVALVPKCAQPGRKQAEKVFYGRLDGDSYFKTAMASLRPNSKGAWILHPNQARVLTIREAARSQGFPDHYHFSGPPTKQYRQIGNAVPVHLALALGRSLGEALQVEWGKDQREESPEL